jgi:spermidine synthase
VFLPLAMMVLPVALAYLTLSDRAPMWIQIGVHSFALFVGCMVCHGETVSRRPDPSRLTGFYLAISAGGALGGVLVALVAPAIFKGFWEMPIGLGLCWVVSAGMALVLLPGWWRAVAVAALIPMAYSAAFYVVPALTYSSPTLRQVAAVRNFYGMLKVKENDPDDPAKRRYTLVHGATIHGFQYTAAARRLEATSYYATNSGIGLARRWSQLLAEHSLRVGCVGLGTGSVAAYGSQGDEFTFYEINPAVPRLSGPGGYFTYLTETPAHVEIVMGDARLSLERELREGSRNFDVLALDAFSSDAIPAHLLTAQAFEVYLGHLRYPDGILAVHISNRCLDLQPVIWGLADYFGLQGELVSAKGNGESTFTSDWLLLTFSQRFLETPVVSLAASQNLSERQVPLWTDDYYNLFGILK